ncbi:hypothetical protein [Streptomyces alboflavus]|uniref:hypothetical protein n=1 Tax=Streptomyces alboflavus TaxID=67267 RepID=UPI000F657DC9|nr:hypothetical protein [Streptomyces alboflavus]
MISELTEPLNSLDWNDTSAVNATSSKLLDTLATNRALLRDLVEQVPGNERLCELSEHYDILDKLVLHDDPSGFRLRLHVFLPGYFDRPHNHRWTYTSRILRGSYQHTLYGLDNNLDENTDITALQPYMVRTEKAGDSYTLHHGMIHAAVAEPHTATLIVRGPAMKERFLVADRTTGESWWQYGAARESKQDAQNKLMSGERMSQTLRELAEYGII